MTLVSFYDGTLLCTEYSGIPQDEGFVIFR